MMVHSWDALLGGYSGALEQTAEALTAGVGGETDGICAQGVGGGVAQLLISDLAIFYRRA